MLSRAQLQQLANATSFSRGEDYFYNNAVRRIKRAGNTFTGKVEGSELYEVSLTLSHLNSEFDCSCPYYYEGICKHCVAFGLAVIDQFGPVVQLVDSPTIPDQPLVSLEEVWHQTSTDQKINFLRQLLEKQPELQVQFAQFIGTEQPALKPVFFTKADNEETTSIDTISTEVFEALSELRFDDEGLEMDEDDYYSEESPDPDPLIESILSEYAERVAKALREGRLTDTMTIYLGVYEGALAAYEPDDDNYGIIDDYPSQTWAVWQNLLAETYAQMAGRVLHPDQISQALNQLGERVRYFDELENNPDEIYYDIKAFEPLLLALVTDTPSARIVQQAITQYGWQSLGTEYVQLRIADVLHDQDLWLKTAETFADHDKAIGLQLLQRRQQSGNLPILLQTLHRLTKHFPGTFDAFILEHLTTTSLAPGPDLSLYLNALENRCRSIGHFDDYLTLREFWTDTQRRQFADSFLSAYASHPLFLAQVLHAENRTNDLFDWLKSLNWLYIRQLPDVLKLVAQSHPSECMDLVMDRTKTSLESGQRGRDLYQRIASWLAALATFQSLKPQVAIFAQHLYNTYSRLSALREELRMNRLARPK
ncbi:SWIM zinc finger family protein [Spirosoma foliorum]|uniref:SWIM-type domain-containing protein n=1 Tax=Spirosoma foliorum TaxID=2710596 RepID=A0A7G5GWH8_9BACT|nr:hypothetical protein [Spirosoma foliorum]QMW03220.1 hypothetical protein H3H32_36030 [Spirosoma foliorum]